jgi:hypothetical protein
MNQLAVASLTSLLLFGIGGSVGAIAYGNTQIAAAQAQLDADNAKITRDRNLLINKNAIHAAYLRAQKLHPMGDRRAVLVGLEKFPNVKIRGFNVGNSDNHFKIDITGPYTQLISVVVGFPATVPGVTISNIDVTVDHTPGDSNQNAEAEVTGTLS